MRKVKIEFWWAVHNLIAHPILQILRFVSLFGLLKRVDRWGDQLHDWTTPGSPPSQTEKPE